MPEPSVISNLDPYWHQRWAERAHGKEEEEVAPTSGARAIHATNSVGGVTVKSGQRALLPVAREYSLDHYLKPGYGSSIALFTEPPGPGVSHDVWRNPHALPKTDLIRIWRKISSFLKRRGSSSEIDEQKRRILEVVKTLRSIRGEIDQILSGSGGLLGD